MKDTNNKKKSNETVVSKQPISRTNDLLFKMVFGDAKNSHILMGFINDILDLGVTDVSIENNDIIKIFREIDKDPEIRRTQVDVLARLEDGSRVTIEMQVFPQRLFRERAFFYVASIYISDYGNQTLEGKDAGHGKGERKYSALRPVYSICIMAENEFADDNPIHEFKLYDAENEMYYRGKSGREVITMTFLELKKSSGEIKKNIKAWFDYFNAIDVSKDAPEYIQEAYKLADYERLSEEEAKMISARQWAIDKVLAAEDYFWYEGYDEGKAEGEAKLLKTLLARGKTIQEIVEFTGMSEDEIKTIVK